MTANVCPVRALPGRSQNGTHCRHCRSEKETLAHILGACPYGELLRNSRHHKIRSLLASALRGKNYQVEEEVHGLSTNGSTRRIDIIAIPTRSTSGFIIDPTVRMEMYENQPAERRNATNFYINSAIFLTATNIASAATITDVAIIAAMNMTRLTVWRDYGDSDRCQLQQI
ncbi:hypothetical protein ANN_10041 [Periplaneta americana]|uniref:Reverse transcriptase n=1 Tax=Periplaneta americana TaxID=6978 RepID=A0ABQ8TMY6_PERAM|nr:hypothetical protein ANN_10041 [Periplaneta americana]